MNISSLSNQKPKILYCIICLFGLLLACTQTPPLDRVYNKETVIKDLKEIKEILEPSDFAILENELNNQSNENGVMVNNMSYIEILDSIKYEIQKKKEEELEAQRLIEQQPVQLLHATDSGFEEFNFSLFGKKHKTVGYIIKGKFINKSDKTFVNVEFVDKNLSWYDVQRNPYVEINLNKAFRISCVDYGPSYGNWKKIKNIHLPTTSYESPWRANEIQSFEFYFQPDVTSGNDNGKGLQPVHFNYEPNSCLLIIPIYLEDSKGYKKQTYLSFDIMDDYKNFQKTNP
jgi:hypothetical protein